jgi:hypothetical protein
VEQVFLEMVETVAMAEQLPMEPLVPTQQAMGLAAAEAEQA